MSTMQLPKLADRCPEHARALVVSLRGVALYRGRLSLLCEAAKTSLVWSALF